jgi:serine/threonine-protein kinase
MIRSPSVGDDGRDAGDRSGQVLGGKYRLRRLIGRGGVGEVYQAENTWTGGRVAVKVLRTGHETDPELWQRFFREARAAAAVVHPNVVAVIDLGQDEAQGCIFMVQELLEGQSLRERLTLKGQLDLREALDIAVPIMGGLASAHDKGVLHRDLKPENIFLAQRPSLAVTPKLIDFGVSKLLLRTALGGGGETVETETGVMLGTPLYMAPEQIRAGRDLDGRLDVWAMGVVLFEMLAGQPPFKAPQFLALTRLILAGDRPLLQEVAPQVPASIAAIVEQSLQVNREQRFASMRAFTDALLDCPEIQEDAEEPPLRRYRSAVLWRAGEASTSFEPTVLDLPPIPPAAGAPAAPQPRPAETAATPTQRPAQGAATPTQRPADHVDSPPSPLSMATPTSIAMPESLATTLLPSQPLDPENESTKQDTPPPPADGAQVVSQRLATLLVDSRLTQRTSPRDAAFLHEETQPPRGEAHAGETPEPNDFTTTAYRRPEALSPGAGPGWGSFPRLAVVILGALLLLSVLILLWRRG